MFEIALYLQGLNINSRNVCAKRVAAFAYKCAFIKQRTVCDREMGKHIIRLSRPGATVTRDMYVHMISYCEYKPLIVKVKK